MIFSIILFIYTAKILTISPIIKLKVILIKAMHSLFTTVYLIISEVSDLNDRYLLLYPSCWLMAEVSQCSSAQLLYSERSLVRKPGLRYMVAGFHVCTESEGHNLEAH